MFLVPLFSCYFHYFAMYSCFYYCRGMSCCLCLSCGVQYVRRAMSNSEKLELIIVTKNQVLGSINLSHASPICVIVTYLLSYLLTYLLTYCLSWRCGLFCEHFPVYFIFFTLLNTINIFSVFLS